MIGEAPFVNDKVRAVARRLDEQGLRLDVSPELARAARRVLQRLAQGRPVPAPVIDRVIADLGISAADAQTLLGRVAEYNETGAVVGLLGLSLNAHPHSFRVNGHAFSTWCAWDALLLPPLLNAAAEVESIDPESRRTIRLVVGPEDVREVMPATAVVTIVFPAAEGCMTAAAIRSAFCDLVRFFETPESADRWLRTRAVDGAILSLSEAFTLGRIRFASWLDPA